MDTSVDMKRIIIMSLTPFFAVYLLAQEHPRDIRQSLVKTAMSLEGTPYRYGGMSEKGFDCSGFVRTVFMRNNIVLPHSSLAQYRESTLVSLEEARPGDLIFFDVRGKGISHVGIYLGERRFIHAATKIGKVCISSIDEPYWKTRFFAVTRKIPGDDPSDTGINTIHVQTGKDVHTYYKNTGTLPSKQLKSIKRSSGIVDGDRDLA